MEKEEICSECGRSVGFASGLFVNRIIDLDDYNIRKENNKTYPKGEYICRECEEKLIDSLIRENNA